MGRCHRVDPVASVVIWAAATALAAGVSACRETPTGAPAASAAPAVTAAAPRVPVDQLGDGELGEGNDEVLGVKLPRDMSLTTRTPGFFLATGSVSIPRLIEYLKARVTPKRITTSTDTVRLEQAIVSAHPDRVVSLEIRPRGGLTELRLTDITPPKIPPGASEEDLWRRAGLRGDGRLVDPTHQQ